MPTKTLTATRTKTITTAKMLTATLALVLANGAALAAVPLQERPVMNIGSQCPIFSIEFEQSCGQGKYAQARVECEGLEVNLLVQPQQCLTTEALTEQAALACQQECLAYR